MCVGLLQLVNVFSVVFLFTLLCCSSLDISFRFMLIVDLLACTDGKS